MSAQYSFYIAAIVVGVLITFIFLARLLARSEQQRQKRLLRSGSQEEVISTDFVKEKHKERSREKAQKSLQSRFSIIRKLAIVFLTLLAITAVVTPFLGKMPQAIISIFVAGFSIFIGIASKPVLENFIAGIVMTFGKPFRVGDTVIVDGDYYGSVEDITMTYTIIKVWDWRRYVIPNSRMISKDFINLTLHDHYIWSHVEFWVAPDSDLSEVKDVAIAAAKNSKAYLSSEEPHFWVMEMADKGVRCWVAAWAANPADSWDLCSDIRLELCKQFTNLRISTHRFNVDFQDALKKSGLEAALQTQVE